MKREAVERRAEGGAMARNVEIKARATDLERQIRIAERFADGPPETIRQEDVFFTCPEGRLKLRCFPDGRGQLIYYERPDKAGPKKSAYAIAPVERADPLRETLARALGAVGVVRKARTLLRVGPTRIHFDSVENLGDFIEDTTSVSPIEAVIMRTLKDHTENVLKSLTPREEQVLKLRFGIGDGTEHTLEEVGRKMGVTRERVRQIEAQALSRLRHPSIRRKLRDYLGE